MPLKIIKTKLKYEHKNIKNIGQEGITKVMPDEF